MVVCRLLSVAIRCGVVSFSVSYARRILANKQRPAAVLKFNTGRNSKILIVTTAAIPWRTGTAVNPALRAAELAAGTEYEVTLVVPFVPVQDQRLIFPEGVVCETPQQQEAIIKAWAREHSGLPAVDFQVLFYHARYYPTSRCIFAVEDVCRLLPRDQVSLVLLEEPEHLNWYRAGSRWTSQFRHVVGVLHTHYSGYAADLPGGPINKAAVGLVCRVVCRLHCHKVIQLSLLAKGMTRSTIVNVHGVSAKFLQVGEKKSALLRWQQQQQAPIAAQQDSRAQQLTLQEHRQRQHAYAQQHGGQQQQQQVVVVPAAAVRQSCFSQGAYFLGKALWDKGHGELMELLQTHEAKHGQVCMDVYGNGPDLVSIQAAASKRGLQLVFKGQADHCSPALQEYKIFINCCKKDVLATATAEAVAMNKWAILPEAPCNEFFRPFPNVLLFSTPAGFSAALMKALEQDPPPLTPQHLRELSWAAATERLLAAASIQQQEWPGAASQLWDDCLWVPYRMFAMLFIGARNFFAPAPKLLAAGSAAPQQQQQRDVPQLLVQPLKLQQQKQQQHTGLLQQLTQAEQQKHAAAAALQFHDCQAGLQQQQQGKMDVHSLNVIC